MNFLNKIDMKNLTIDEQHKKEQEPDKETKVIMTIVIFLSILLILKNILFNQ